MSPLRAILISFVMLAAWSCGGEDTTKVSIQVYPAEGLKHNNLLTDGSSDFLELVVSGGPLPFAQRFDLVSRRGEMLDLPLGTGYRMEARGYRIGVDGNPQLNFYGASPRFAATAGSTARITVQVGAANCVAYNRPSSFRAPQGTADLTELRTGTTATVLPDGRVVIIGGATIDGAGNTLTGSGTVEIYDPIHSQFIMASTTPGVPCTDPSCIFRLSEPRAFHTATLLPNGEILIVGGLNALTGAPSSSVTTLNVDGAVPVETPVNIDPTFEARYNHQALRLPDSSVLIAGGLGAGDVALDSSFRYSPVDFSFRRQGRMKVARTGHTLSPMLRGTELALVAGGKAGSTVHGGVEVFTVNPQQVGCQDGAVPSALVGCWVEMPQLEMEPPRWGHSAVAAYQGEDIVLIGGYSSTDESEPLDEIRVIDQSLSALVAAGNLVTPRGGIAAVETSDGAASFIVLFGGRRAAVPQQSVVRLVRQDANGAIRYNVESLADGCIQPNAFPESRWNAKAVRLSNDVVMVVGGSNQGQVGYSASRRAELYFPPHVSR